MAELNKSFGRGRRLQSVIQRIPDKKPNNLEHQLHMARANEYTNESIERFSSKLADKQNDDGYSSGLDKIQPIKELQLNLSQLEVGDKSEKQEIICRSSNIDSMPSKQPHKGDIGQVNILPCSSCDNVGKHKSRLAANFSKKELTIIPCSKSHGKKGFTQNSQLLLSPKSSKSLGRGQRLNMVVTSLPKPERTLQNEIEMACGTDYSNQSIESFVKQQTVREDN